MSCCGKKRAAISKPLSSTPAPSKHPTPDSVVWFQYTGASNLTVIRRVTNVSYQFAHQGAVLASGCERLHDAGCCSWRSSTVAMGNVGK